MSVVHRTAATGVDSGDGRISLNAWNESHSGTNNHGHTATTGDGGLIAAGLGIVLYNVALSGLAIGLLILGFARPAPATA